MNIDNVMLNKIICSVRNDRLKKSKDDLVTTEFDDILNKITEMKEEEKTNENK